MRLYVPVGKADDATDRSLHRRCTHIITRIQRFRHQSDSPPHLDLSALAMLVDHSGTGPIFVMTLGAEGKSAPKKKE